MRRGVLVRYFVAGIVGFCSSLIALPAFSATDVAAGAIDEPGGIPASWKLVWADEFDVGGLPDPNKWGYDTHRNRIGWHNQEKQYYANERSKNTRVENGSLIIETHQEELPDLRDWNNQAYSSGRLLTSGRASWTYGGFEIRAKLPCGRGTWPAIWLLPAQSSLRWPDGGEIDIMEHVGFDEGVVHGTVHTGAYNHVKNTQKAATTNLPDLCKAFHRYQLVWTKDALTIGVDDRHYFRFANDGEGELATWPFDRPMYLLLNTAVGGSWAGRNGIDDAVFPVRFEIDYVRVWQPAQ
jgi:beta-glucanase (GH16 family)